jgi:anti-anti-sigma regulatory factor
MRLALRQEEGVSVLEVSGPVDLQNFQVLKAGLAKLLRDGKNRIALKINDADQVPSEVMRELAILDVTARELSGQIILVSANDNLKQSVRSFAKPPVIPILSTLELAHKYFKEKTDEEEGGESVDELKKLVDAKDKQIASLETRIKQMDPAELQKLRADKAELASKVSLLEGQVGELLKAQRQPGDVEGFLEKISFLEDTIKKFSGAAAEKKG